MLYRILSSPSAPSPLQAAASSRSLGPPQLPPNNIQLNHIRNACTLRFLSTAYHGLSIPSNQRKKQLGVVRTSSSADGEEVNDSDDEIITDDYLRATIRETKKVLEIQRNLLEQIAERRNLEPSTGKYTKEEEPAPYNQNDSSFSNGIGNDEEHDRNSWNSSDSFTQLSTEYGTVDNDDDDDGESINGLDGEQSVADGLGLSREANFEQSQLPAVPTQSQPFPALLESQPLPVLHEEPESNVLRDENLRVPAEAYVQASRTQQKPPPKEGSLGGSPLAGQNVMNVIVVAAECAPWSKTGGLGDVIGALPKALARRGHRVMVVVPRYGDYAEAKEIGELRRCKVYGQDLDVTYYQTYIDHVDFVFIDSPIFHNIGNDIYGGNRLEVLKRMVFFCKVAVEVPWHVPCGGVCYGDGNLVFVANDWHTSLLPVFLKAYYREKGFMKYARCVLVIHNIAHQGRGPLQDFSQVDLPDNYKDLFRLHDPVGGVHFNIFAAGLKTADRVVTVSAGYAWEVKTPEGGWGLHKLMNDIDWKSHGIVNGIDTKSWNPKIDAHLQSDGYTNYSPESFRKGKAQCKAALQRELGLPIREDVPIIAFIGRLDYQKGVDIIADAMQWLVGQDIQLIMLGSGSSDLEDMLRKFEKYHHEKVRGWVGFSVKMAHRITAGADILLMPSRYEPCGLNQLYGFMYGTVPVVHAVGGLKDTVKQYDPYNETGLGWTFERAEANLMIQALGHALNTYRNYEESWEGLQRRGMAQDLSWDNAAQQYEEVLVAAKYHW